MKTTSAVIHGARLASLLVLLAAVAGPFEALSAQRGGGGRGGAVSLDRVEELTRLGRAEEARTALTGWWESAAADASRRDMQRGLWLRGRLTVDPAQAELDFQRLIVLYPSGEYTPEALLRLAQAAHGRGDEESARGYVAALARDYANDPVRREAEAWLRGAGPAEPVEARAEASRGGRGEGARERPGRRGRDDTSGAAAAGRGGGGGAGVPADADREAEFSVQLGAFADADRALALLEDVREAGVDVRLVRVVGSRFLHVRVGRFRERPEAAEQLEALERLGFSAAIVRDERTEQAVRVAGER